MRIKWYGTATLLIESGDSRLLIDPYLKKFAKSAPPIPMDEARSANAIFITHPHLDHFSDIDAFTAGGGRPVYVSRNGIEHAMKNGLNTDCMVAVSTSELYKVGAFTVTTYQSRHCVYDAATILRIVFSPRSWFHLKDLNELLKGKKNFPIENDIYALEISDGEKTVMIFGSAGMDENIAYPQAADLLVFPYQGRADIHRSMDSFLSAMQPKKIMIDHFDDAFPPFTHRVNLKKFIPTVKKRLPNAEALIPVENEWYTV